MEVADINEYECALVSVLYGIEATDDIIRVFPMLYVCH